MPQLLTSQEIVAILSSLIACLTSLKDMRIPNWLTFPAALLGLAINAYDGKALNSIFGWILMVFLGVPGKAKLSFGAIKQLAAIGAALGSLAGFVNFVVFSIVYLLVSLTYLRSADNELDKAKLSKKLIPLGPMILISTILTVSCLRAFAIKVP